MQEEAETHIVIALFIRLRHLTISTASDFTHRRIYVGAEAHSLHLFTADRESCLVIVYLPDTIDLPELDGSS